MPIQRVAVIFDNEMRPDTTGIYCRRTLGEMVEVEHFLPSELAEIPRSGFDLYLNVDDGLCYNLPGDLRPCAWWAIDTHLNLDWCQERAEDFDWVFAAQRNGAEHLKRAGIASAQWLPLACDPVFHRKHDLAKSLDICFVGHVFPGIRAELLERLSRRFSNHFIGQKFLEQMAMTYSAARTVFNRSIKNDINMRVFEALACGSLLVTNDLRENGQEDLFRDGVHLSTYHDADDLIDKVVWYLQHASIREQIAAAGRAEVLAKHTYRHRIELILRDVEHGQHTTVAGMKLPSLCDAAAVQVSSADPPIEVKAAAEKYSSPADNFVNEHSECDLNRELGTWVPDSAQRVLVLGQESPDVKAALCSHSPRQIIWMHPSAAIAADPDRPRASSDLFDVIVCGSVLEHVEEPLRVLRVLQGYLSSNGHVLASFTNARHCRVLLRLLDGHGESSADRASNRAPRRLYTRREIAKLFYRAGLGLEDIKGVHGGEYDSWRTANTRDTVRIGQMHVSGLPHAEAEEFHITHFLARAYATVESTFGLTSIVIVTHNLLVHTRRCLDNIRRLTHEPYELIVVDNASTDGTISYLESVEGVRVCRNSENRGFPAAANQGIQLAAGRQVLLLNNDTVVTTGWLRRLLRTLYSNPTIGMAGPSTNHISGPQEVAVSYEDLSGLDAFAWDWGQRHDGIREEDDRLVGFCLLIRRDVIERIGLLDERFGIGCFEDDDYCRRALLAGFRLVIARDAFVHHVGSQTFRASGTDYAALMRRNEDLFRKKWPEQASQSALADCIGTTAPTERFVIRAAQNAGLLLERSTINLSLCMIARDNRRTIRQALQSIQPWVDEMIVVDTGSLDETPEIAAELGAHVFRFPWCDDFSAARNESVRHASGKWIFWMDSDDTIDAQNGEKLRALVRIPRAKTLMGFVVQVRCPNDASEGADDFTAVDHLKVFRNLPTLRFEGKIHEQIIPAINRVGGNWEWTDIFVVHSGSDQTQEGQARKLERDLRILHHEFVERPNHPFVLFNLGMTYRDARRYSEAEDFLRRCIRHSQPHESHLRKAYAFLVDVCHQQARADDARRECEEGLRLFPEDAELRFLFGGLLHDCGQLSAAAEVYQSLFDLPSARYFSSRNDGITGFLAHHNLAVVYTALGGLLQAEKEWRQVVDLKPCYRAGWSGLADNLLLQGKKREVEVLVTSLQEKPPLEAEAATISARVRMQCGDTRGARQELEEAVRRYPDDAAPLDALCRLCFEHGEPDDAEAALKKKIRRDPTDGSAYHNLGTVNRRMGRIHEAIGYYRESLLHRPNSADTYFQLGLACRDANLLAEATEAWEHARKLAPHSAEVATALVLMER